MKKNISVFAVFSLFLAFQSCQDEVDTDYFDYTEEELAILSKRLNLPNSVYNYTSTLFLNGEFPETTNASTNENHKATLGRVLFYDNLLSKNESVSCASCHKQELAFSDDVPFSEGFDGDQTFRNSLALGTTVGFDIAYGESGSEGAALFGWDEANDDIKAQSEAAILNEVEMGHNMLALMDKIEKEEYYQVLFKKVYGSQPITKFRMLDAINKFVNSLASDNSKFDRVRGNKITFDVNGQPIERFNEIERRGESIYVSNCAQCHSFNHSFTLVATANNGLDMNYSDKGIGLRTGQTEDNGVFKVPFLRNIELTAPYMHDGRFETLVQVINHYSDGIQNHPNLDHRLKINGVPKKMDFNNDEKKALLAYLETLTDPLFIVDTKFSDPFK